MNKIKEIWANRKVRFGVITFLYILWFVVWTQNPLWLIGVVFIYDYYFTRFIDKIFLNRYRKFKQKNRTLKVVMEWVEALLFAIIVVVPLKLYFFGLYVIPSSSMESSLLVGDYLFVNKLTYGPKMPNTPISFPFVQHTLPLTKESRSWVDWVQFDYKRLWGFSKIKNNDVVVFQFPAGDTVALNHPNSTYYDLVRRDGWKKINAESRVIYRPVDKRENYIKRCVAIAGDTLTILNGVVYVNSMLIKDRDKVQHLHMIYTDGSTLGGRFFEEFQINPDEIYHDKSNNLYMISITSEQAREIEKLPEIAHLERYVSIERGSDATFPHQPELYPWNEDNYGPIWIPQKGATIPLTIENLPLYERIIKNYELNEISVQDSIIMINGLPTQSYTFNMNYYFMMGDNRHNSLDSRYWGFVPEDHIEGKATLVWLSITPGKNIFSGLRWSKMFRSIK